MSALVRIVEAHDDDERVDAVRALFREYERFLDVDLCFQDFERELADLPGEYRPPSGAMLLALAGEEPAGCVAMRACPYPDDAGEGRLSEMKRMWVRAPYRSTGLGRRLAVAIMERARACGHARMCLDTLPKLESAIALYRKLGFVERPPYYHNPLPGVLYLEAGLDNARLRDASKESTR